ncbi:hypothetical protein HYW42_05280 [Candidatus Daviesbacteria bacterium]|nr:hypothetical protein [Candidatus Daviesbacteria bacterium]
MNDTLPNRNSYLRDLAYRSILELSTDEGINASSKDEVYGCIFGRDSAITILKILRAVQSDSTLNLLDICRKALLTLVSLQGKEFHIDTGEQPGKFIHEFRKDPKQLERFLKSDTPWFIHSEGILKNYDSIDSTPLTLIAIYKYYQITKDRLFLESVLPSVEEGLNWIISYGDMDKDLFVEYDFPAIRKFGGLRVQSWTDSVESIADVNGNMPEYPIAPIEAQSYTWLALMLWGDFFTLSHPEFASKIYSQAGKLKTRFNKEFILRDIGLFYGAQALDGRNKQIKTVTGNPMLCLWAAYINGNQVECILDKKYINDFVQRAFMADLFVSDAGIRTMSSEAATFNPNKDSYHNGSFWPVLNGMVIEGLENFGFFAQARLLKEATLIPITFFNCPIEVYIKNEDGFCEYLSTTGQTSCKYQAWSAAALLDCLSVKNGSLL